MQVEDRFCIYLEFVHPGSINKYVRDHYGAVTESVVRNFTAIFFQGWRTCIAQRQSTGDGYGNQHMVILVFSVTIDIKIW